MKLKAEFIGKDMFSQELNRILIINEENKPLFIEHGYTFLFEDEVKPAKPKVKKVKNDKDK